MGPRYWRSRARSSSSRKFGKPSLARLRQSPQPSLIPIVVEHPHLLIDVVLHDQIVVVVEGDFAGGTHRQFDHRVWRRLAQGHRPGIRGLQIAHGLQDEIARGIWLTKTNATNRHFG